MAIRTASYQQDEKALTVAINSLSLAKDNKARMGFLVVLSVSCFCLFRPVVRLEGCPGVSLWLAFHAHAKTHSLSSSLTSSLTNTLGMIRLIPLQLPIRRHLGHFRVLRF